MSQPIDTIEYYDRSTGELCHETVLGDAAIKWAYGTLSGKMLAPLLFGSSLPSRILGWYFDSPLSRKKINKTIIDLHIDESEFAITKDQFGSFNDFFTRKLKSDVRPFSQDESSFLSPADGRLLVYPDIDGQSCIHVKGIDDSLNNLFGRELNDFNGGKAAVVRLCPSDYHRYHFPVDGHIAEQVNVKGQYHSVNPVALQSKKRIFCLNKRTYTLIDTIEFRRIAFMEVGAFGVAGIHQTFTGTAVKRMQEKGYFKFGGSTIVLLFQKDAIEFDIDLRDNSARGVETLVKVGERIGSSKLSRR